MEAEKRSYFSEIYKNSLPTRVVTHILLLFVSVIPISVDINGSPEYFMQLVEAEGGDVAASGSIISWCSCLMLLRTFNFNRVEFYFGLLAGALALFFGDFLAALYWAGVTALFISLLKYRTGALFIYASIVGGTATHAYYEIYDFSQPTALNIFLALIALTGLFRETLWAQLKMIRPNRTGQNQVQPKRKDDGLSEDFKARPTPVPQADESVWGPGEKESKEFEESIPAPAAVEKRPTLTAAQLPFAAYWLELHKLKGQPALPESLQSELDGVIGFTEHILECMQEDANDVQPGSAFLNRYLAQVTMVVKRGQSLSGKLSTHGKNDEIEQQCLYALKALHSAFAQQHMRLLENDTLEFESDLTVLNSLLKNDGFKQ